MARTLKERIARLEAVGEAWSVGGTEIISTFAPSRDDERDCIGLLSACGGPWRKITRRPGEPLAAMDRRAEIGEGDSIPCWIRVYSDGDELERLELFATAPEVGLPP